MEHSLEGLALAVSEIAYSNSSGICLCVPRDHPITIHFARLVYTTLGLETLPKCPGVGSSSLARLSPAKTSKRQETRPEKSR